MGAPPEPRSVKMARQLYDIGVSTPEALTVIAEVWRATPPASDTHVQEVWHTNRRTLELMEMRGLLKAQPSSAYFWLIREWQFPMYGLDLSQISVRIETLREHQQNWSPDG